VDGECLPEEVCLEGYEMVFGNGCMEKLNCEAHEVELGHNCVVVDEIDEEHITHAFERIVEEAFGDCLVAA